MTETNPEFTKFQEELKTLKDIEEEFSKNATKEVGENISGIVLVEDLKAEAIKWVKEIRKDKSIGVQLFTDGKKRKGNPIGKAIYGDTERKIINQEKIDFIMDFFNLTEEDLK